jgi:hypothetical protein
MKRKRKNYNALPDEGGENFGQAKGDIGRLVAVWVILSPPNQLIL